MVSWGGVRMPCCSMCIRCPICPQTHILDTPIRTYIGAYVGTACFQIPKKLLTSCTQQICHSLFPLCAGIQMWECSLVAIGRGSPRPQGGRNMFPSCGILTCLSPSSGRRLNVLNRCADLMTEKIRKVSVCRRKVPCVIVEWSCVIEGRDYAMCVNSHVFGVFVHGGVKLCNSFVKLCNSYARLHNWALKLYGVMHCTNSVDFLTTTPTYVQMHVSGQCSCGTRQSVRL